MLYLFNQNEELQTILKEYKEASHTEQLNKDNFFEFWVPANHPDSQFIKEENFVAFKDEDGELRLFVIKELEEVHDDVLYKEVFCKAAWMDELEDEVLEESNAQDQTMEDALSEALQSTRWQVGEVAELGLNDADFYFESVLSAINKILSTWGGEVKDRIVISDNQITDRYIDILPRRGADTGKTLSISKDLQSIHRTVVSYPKTALYGRGKGEEGDGSDKRLTFEEVEWSTEKGDPVDKPLGQKWVGDPEALKKYGRENFTRHRFDFFDSSDEEDPKQLLTNTWNALQEKNQILVSYDLSAISLEKIAGLEHEKVRL
ncbi:phage tail spike protein, partial [Jeotgalibacillus marinus]